MPKGTVIEHKNGSVKLRIPFDAGAASYRFYTNDVGSGDPETMAQRASIAAPVESPAGFHEFDISDEILALRPDRGWHVRITKVTGSLETAVVSEPPTLIRESDGGGKTVGAEVGPTAKFDGTAGKGLFNFGQRERTKIIRVRASFSVSSGYSLSLKNAAGVETVVDTGAGVDDFLFDDGVTLEPGDKLVLTSTVNGTHKADATRE